MTSIDASPTGPWATKPQAWFEYERPTRSMRIHVRAQQRELVIWDEFASRAAHLQLLPEIFGDALIAPSRGRQPTRLEVHRGTAQPGWSWTGEPPLLTTAGLTFRLRPPSYLEVDTDGRMTRACYDRAAPRLRVPMKALAARLDVAFNRAEAFVR